MSGEECPANRAATRPHAPEPAFRRRATPDKCSMGEVSDETAYLRFPHLHDDSLCFVAEDDLWIAPSPRPGSGPSGPGG